MAKYPVAIFVAVLIMIGYHSADAEGWRSYRDKKQVSPSLEKILREANVNPASRQKLVQGLNSRQQQQLAADLESLKTAIHSQQYAKQKARLLQQVSKPLTPEAAYNLLAQLNVIFSGNPWWNRINMLAVNQIGTRGV